MQNPQIPAIIRVELPALLRAVEQEIKTIHPEIQTLSTVRYEGGKLIVEVTTVENKQEILYVLEK